MDIRLVEFDLMKFLKKLCRMSLRGFLITNEVKIVYFIYVLHINSNLSMVAFMG